MHQRYLWATVSIAITWLATIGVAILGSSSEATGLGCAVFRVESSVVNVTVPTVLVMALFAMIATIAVGSSGFRDQGQ